MNNNIDDKIVKSICDFVYSQSKICQYFNKTYKSQKYTLEQILPIILFVLKQNISWRNVNELKMTNNMHWNTIYKMHQKLIKHNVYQNSYSFILNKYYKKKQIKMI